MSVFEIRINKRTLASEILDEHGSQVCSLQLYPHRKRVLRALRIDGLDADRFVKAINALQIPVRQRGKRFFTTRKFELKDGSVPTIVIERRSYGSDAWFVCSWLGDANRRFKGLEISKGRLMKIAEREKSKFAVAYVNDDFRVSERFAAPVRA